MPRLELKSPEYGSLLIFEVTSHFEEEIVFNVGVKTPWFSGTAPSSTFMVTSPVDFFREMAAEWAGWKQKKSWSDLENRVTFEATTDSTGHISLAVVLNAQDYDSHLRVILMFEAGQLEAMSNELALIFE